MFTTVVVPVCLNLAVPGTCVTVPVVNPNQDQLTMGGCMELEGFESANDYWKQHPLSDPWKLKGGACQICNCAPVERGTV